MALTEQELAAKRAHAEQLRHEIRSARSGGSTARLEAERQIDSAALDQEILDLERQVLEETRSVGGTVEDAMAAMKRAEDVGRMVAPPPKEESEDSPVNLSPAPESDPATEDGGTE